MSNRSTAKRMTYRCTQTFQQVSKTTTHLEQCEYPSNRVLEWASGDRNAIAQWDYGVTDDGVAYHKVYRQTQLLFSENTEQAEWGEWYWATDDQDGLSYQSGPDVDVRGAFAKNGKLANSDDKNYRAISTNWPVFAFSRDPGSVKTSAGTLFSIGLAQDSAIQYSGKPEGTTVMPSLWKSYFSTATAAVSGPLLFRT